MATISEIESIEAYATSLLELTKKMRAKLEKPRRKKGGLSEETKALLYADREKTLNRRNKPTS